jgi:hypothetical protein
MVAEIDSIQKTLAAKSEGLELFPRGESPIVTPGKYLTINAEQLENKPELLGSLIVCYQQVYGSAEKGLDNKILWGEGGRCSQEGWEYTIPLDKLRELQKEGKDTCPLCQSSLVECYPSGELAGRIELELSEGEHPFLTLMLGDEDMLVAGFAWGTVLKSPSEVGKRLIQARYSDSPEIGTEVVAL